MNVLLVGGSGFVGRAVLSLLVGRDDLDVVAVTRGVTSQRWSGVTHVACDRSDNVSLQQGLRDRRFDVVIDVTGYIAADVEGLLSALEEAPRRYIMVSSAAVYDRRQATPPFVEGDLASGDLIWGDYGVGKHRAEAVLSGVDEAYILRPPYIYGPGNSLQREQFLWARLLADETILVPGDGETRLQMCHVGDVANLLLQATDGLFEPGVYNIGEPAFFSFNTYIEALAQAANLAISGTSITYVKDDHYAARQHFSFRENDLLLDTTHLTRQNPAFRFVELPVGLRSTLGWCKREDRLRLERNDVELEILRTS